MHTYKKNLLNDIEYNVRKLLIQIPVNIIFERNTRNIALRAMQSQVQRMIFVYVCSLLDLPAVLSPNS